jgi:prephenate dehydrogenase
MKIGIIGYGRFGKLLASILKSDFEITVFEKSTITLSSEEKQIRVAKSISEVKSLDVIFIAVPINKFEQVLKIYKKYLLPNQLIIDVLSVKMFAQKSIQTILPKIPAILTHPMFGPDGVKQNGLPGLNMMIYNQSASKAQYDFWYKYFQSKKLNLIEMTPREHDKLAADSQGIAHFIGRLLQLVRFQPTEIDTVGAKKLHEIKNMVINDSWELFYNLQTYNPYTKSMRLRLLRASDKLYNKLIPEKVSDKYTIYGIQGGRGSFNELALMDFLKRHSITNYKIKYLYTTEKVLNALHKGEIDFGQFATHNSIGGIVSETIQAIAKYKFEIVEDFAIKIQHNLMKRKDVEVNEIDTVMAHDQVLKQCKGTLSEKYPKLKMTTGQGDLIDTAKAAEAVKNGRLPKNLFILGNPIIADLFDFDTIDTNLQDSKENFTSFLMVKRY